MKSKINRILVIVLIVWFNIFTIDITATYFGYKPVLVVRIQGGEVVSYVGLGYVVDYFYPLTSGDSPTQSYYSINTIPYIIINCIVLGFVLINFLMKRHKDNVCKDIYEICD